MSGRLIKPVVSALAVVFAVALLALAQQPAPKEMGKPQRQPMDIPSSMGAMDAYGSIPATVAEVNHQQKTVKLQMQDGAMIQLRVPEESLSTLSRGDSVQVSIRKMEGQPGIGSDTQSQRPDPGTGPKPRSGQ